MASSYFQCCLLFIFRLFIIIIIQIMQFSQSRVSSRGGLIAVLKIEIDTNRTDRIFLHQNDDDYKLAEQFIDKHNIHHNLTEHIYQKIKFSRQAVQNNAKKMPFTPRVNQQQQNKKLIRNASQKPKAVITPFQKLMSQKNQNQLSDQSFGLKRDLKQFINERDTNSNQTQKKSHKRPDYGQQTLQEAPKKKMYSQQKQFMLYGQDNNLQYEIQEQLKLFPKSKYAKTDSTPCHPRENTSKFDTEKLEKMAQRQVITNKIYEILQKFDKTKHEQLQNESKKQNSQLCKVIQRNRSKSVNNNIEINERKIEYHSKPKNVKILIKDPTQSLNQSLKRSISKQEISRINRDVTKRLYNQAQLKKHYLQIIKEKAQIDKDKLEQAELTHKPEINKVSRIIASSRKNNQIPVELHLIQQGKKIQFKRQQEANKKYLKEIENCTFEPQINLISKKLAEKSKDGSISNFRSKTNKYINQNLYKPQLSKITNELMKNKGKFQERQKQFLQQKHVKLVEKLKQKRLRERIDSITGQQLYKPAIHDIGVRENKGTKIGTYLYLLSKQSDISQQNHDLFQPKINETSALLVQQQHFKRISWIFSELDRDQDGLISSHKISIDGIPIEILNIIKPILFQMQQLNVELSLLQFKAAIQILHKKLAVSQRNCLYNSKLSKRLVM